MKYKVDLPYPDMSDVKPNANDLKLIMQDYAGMVSEFTAIMQYFYHHLWAEKDNFSDIANDLMQISIVEMHHFEILGGLILKLGGDPKFVSSVNCNCLNCWTPEYVDYSKTITKILLENIAGEKAAIKSYSLHAKCASQESVSAILKRIIMDEELHIEILSNLLKNLDSNTDHHSKHCKD